MRNLQAVGERLATDGWGMARYWQQQGKWAEALALVESLFPLEEMVTEATNAHLYLTKAQILRDQALFGGVTNHEEREDTLTRALAYAERTEDKALLGQVWDTWGRSLHATYLASDRSAEPPQEMEYFQRALALRTEANDAHGIAESTFHIGIVHQVVRKDARSAFPYFQDSYEQAVALQDDLLASYAIRHIGFAKDEQGDKEGARADFEESLRLREAVGFIPGVAMAQWALAQQWAEMGEPTRALPLLERAYDTFMRLKSQRWASLVEKEIAAIRGGES